LADRTNLEIGVPVVVAGWDLFTFMFAQVAYMSGALPLILVGTDVASAEFVPNQQVDTVVDVTNPVRVEAVLVGLLSSVQTNCVVIETTGDPAILDLLLETLPAWSHLVLRSHASRMGTVDFYRNVHRKGLTIVGVPQVQEVFPSPDEYSGGWAAAYWQRAWRLLGRGWVRPENVPVNWCEQVSVNPRPLYEVQRPTMLGEKDRDQLVCWLPPRI
jgi:threonine dehydrogenase-like Zn-dependent dehydrogenase